MLNKFKKLFNYYRVNGSRATIKWFSTNIHRRVFENRHILFFVDLIELQEKYLSLPENITMERIASESAMNSEDLKKLIEGGSELMGKDAGKLIIERFAKGAVLWLVRINGTFAAFHWTISKDPLRPTFMPHTEKDVHGIGGEVFEEYRDLGLYGISVNYLFHKLKNEGFVRFYVEAREWNKSSLRAMAKAEYRKFGIAKKRQSLRGRTIVTWYEMCNRK